MKTSPTQLLAGVPEECVALWEHGISLATLTNRQRFLNACACAPVDRPPVWLMRQAGRALPEYQALKSKYSFLQLVHTPELAVEATLQPIRRFQFDAAIIFSDILVVAEALGYPFDFRDGGGIRFQRMLRPEADLDSWSVAGAAETLEYVAEAIRLARQALGGKTALLGFAGSPWTLANFMLEGGGAREQTRAKQLFLNDPCLFSRLMEKLSSVISYFLLRQIEAGADAVQIFDTLGGALPAAWFEAASGIWLRRIVAALPTKTPAIIFSKGAHGSWPALARAGARVLSIDWSLDLAETAKLLPEKIAVQGNLDPTLLNTTPQIVAAETALLLEKMCGRRGHIVNLGHGVPPNAGLQNIEALVETVRRY